MRRPSRRDVLAVVGTVGIARGAGAAVATGDEPSAAAASGQGRVAGGGWRMFQHDAGNSGYAPDGGGPVRSVERAWQVEPESASVASGPVTDGDTVFAGGRSGTVYAVDTATGQQRWRRLFDDDRVGVPALADGTLYVPASGTGVYALDASTGERQWVFETETAVDAATTVADGTVYAGTTNGTVHALEAASGDQRWAVEVLEQVFAAPAVVGETVYVATTDRDAGHVYALDAATGDERWRFDADDGLSDPAVVDGSVYVAPRGGTTGLHALDAATGDVRWTRTDEIYGSPAVDGDTVYAGTVEGDLFALDAASGDEQWSRSLGTTWVVAPAVSDSTVYAPVEHEGVYALDAATGDGRWSVEDTVSRASPALAGHSLYVHLDGSLARFGAGGENLTRAPTGTGTDDDGARESQQSVRDWLDGWAPLLAWLVGVPVLGSLVLAALVAATGRLDERPTEDERD